jgi:hypothetical protein
MRFIPLTSIAAMLDSVQGLPTGSGSVHAWCSRMPPAHAALVVPMRRCTSSRCSTEEIAEGEAGSPCLPSCAGAHHPGCHAVSHGLHVSSWRAGWRGSACPGGPRASGRLSIRRAGRQPDVRAQTHHSLAAVLHPFGPLFDVVCRCLSCCIMLVQACLLCSDRAGPGIRASAGKAADRCDGAGRRPCVLLLPRRGPGALDHP